MNIKKVMETALARAMLLSKECDSNSKRSAKWIKCLNHELASEYSPENDYFGYEVYSRGKPKEVLYDITVMKIRKEKSCKRRVCLAIYQECKWQIESELEYSDSRQLVDDLGKLVLGSARNKLFVASDIWHKNDEKRTWLNDIAAGVAKTSCIESFYLGFIPYPEDWPCDRKPTVVAWKNGEWKSC